MRQKAILIIALIVLILNPIFSTKSLAEGDIRQVEGTGKAVLGNGITLEQAEQIALIMAKRNALEKLGSFIISKTDVKNYQLAKDEVTAISAGIVKLVPGLKKVEREVTDGDIIIKVTAAFEIDEQDFEKRIQEYVEESSSSKDIKKLVDRVNQLEKKLEDMASSKNTNYEEAKIQIDEVEQSYQDLSNALLFSGKKIFASINDQRVKRLNRLKVYLTKLKKVADPYKTLKLSITDKPKVEDKGEGKIGITVPVKAEMDQDYYRQTLTITEKYKTDLYTSDDELDNINEEVLGKNDILFRAPLLIVFLNKNEEVLAYYNHEYTYLEIHLHHSDLEMHNELKGPFLDINSYKIPWDNMESNNSWYRLLPEKVVKEISSIRAIYAKKLLEENFEEYYDRYSNYSYIYKTLPVPLSKMMLTEEDVIGLLDWRIQKVEKKIEELKDNLRSKQEKDENEDGSWDFEY